MLVGIERKWTPLNRPDQGVFDTISGQVARVEFEFPYLIPDLRRAPRLLIASDYSGDHQEKHGAKYRALSFLIADQRELRAWRVGADAVRSVNLKDDREMSFKKRKERVRAAAMPVWLHTADMITGLCVTVLIDRALDDSHLASTQDQLISAGLEPELVEKWQPAAFERVMRVLFFGLTFAAGLARAPQPVFWITDDDEIVPDRSKEDFGRLMAAAAFTLFSYKPHIRFTRISDGERGKQSRKDICSIPDIAAGALCHLNATYAIEGTARPMGRVVPIPRSVPPDILELLQWHADNRWPLKRLVFVVQPGPAGGIDAIHNLQHATLDPQIPIQLAEGIGTVAAGAAVPLFERATFPLENGYPVTIAREPKRWLVFDRRGALLADSVDRIDALNLAQGVLKLRLAVRQA
jgi:hypothetical protein